MKQRFYSALHLNRDICQKSSSGGAFTAITDSWFSAHANQAVVYGCAWSETLYAKHTRAETSLQRDAMQGSKYIGSNMSGVMRMVAQDLLDDRYVLFSGTPCQIDGLKSFLRVKGIDYGEQLLTVEVICHGVGSVRYFQDYIAAYEKRYKSKAVGCSFRGKCRPGKLQQMVIKFANGKVYESPAIRYDEFYSAYLGNYILRESCFVCKYAKPERVADISIADHWAEASKQWPTKSLIISNSGNGDRWVQTCMKHMDIREITEDLLRHPNMYSPSKKPADHAIFWDTYEHCGYRSVQKYLGNATVKGSIRRFVNRIAYWLRIKEICRLLKRVCLSGLRK